MICPKCKADIAGKFKFCPECGQNISSVSKESGIENRDAISFSDIKTITDKRDALSMGSANTLTSLKGASLEKHEIILNNRYELQNLLGKGAFAEVYLAKDLKLGRIVALKRLHAGVDTTSVERFRRESSAIASLNHRNIVAVYDTEKNENGDAIVMEYIEGGSLREYLTGKGRLSITETLNLMKGICQGLSYAHRKNLVHRDLKPGNIMLFREGEEIIPKIVDFGLARSGGSGSSDLSLSGYGMGTPGYMPPEQRRSAKDVNHTSDIYAAGKILYEMLTADSPDNVDVSLIPKEAAGFTEIIQKCTRSRPEERYFSAEELLKDLSSVTVSSRPVYTDKIHVGTVMANVCLQCGTQNENEAHFCAKCGAGMFRVCPECGKEGRATMQFCASCGTDIEGFTKLSEAVENMVKYSGDRKWSRVLKECKLFPTLPKLPGKKGGKFIERFNSIKTEAADKSDKAANLKNIIMDAIRGKDYEKASELLDTFLEISYEDAEASELKAKIPQMMADRDYVSTCEKVLVKEKEGDLKTAIELLHGFLGKYPDYPENQKINSRLENLKLSREKEEWGKTADAVREKIKTGCFDSARKRLDNFRFSFSNASNPDEISALEKEIGAADKEFTASAMFAAEASANFGNYSAACDKLTGYIKNNPTGKYLHGFTEKYLEYENKAFNEMSDSVQKLIDENKLQEAEGLLSKIRNLFPSEKFKAAISKLSDLIEYNRSVAAHKEAVSAAEELMRQTRFEEAVEGYQQFVKWNSGNRYIPNIRDFITEISNIKKDYAEWKLMSGKFNTFTTYRRHGNNRAAEKLGVEILNIYGRLQLPDRILWDDSLTAKGILKNVTETLKIISEERKKQRQAALRLCLISIAAIVAGSIIVYSCILAYDAYGRYREFSNIVAEGTNLLDKRKWTEAKEVFQKAQNIRGYESDVPANLLRKMENGIMYDGKISGAAKAIEKKDYDLALKLYREALSLEGFDNDSAVNAGMKDVYSRQLSTILSEGAKLHSSKKLDEALYLYEAAGAIPGYEDDSKLQKAIKLCREDKFKAMLAKTRELLAQKKYNSAVKAFNDAMGIPGFEKDSNAESGMKSAKDKIETYQKLLKSGVSLAKDGKLLEAIKDLSEADQIAGSDTTPELGTEARSELKKANDALELKKKTDDAKRAFADAVASAGNICESAKNLPDKKKAYREYCKAVTTLQAVSYDYLSKNDQASLDSKIREIAGIRDNLEGILPPDFKKVSKDNYASIEGLADGSAEALKLQKQIVDATGFAVEVETAVTKIKFRLIPPGKFTMGSPEGEKGREQDEGPCHNVVFTKPIYVSAYEITWAQWEKVLGRIGRVGINSDFVNGACPVRGKFYNDCVAFTDELCKIEGVPPGTYRLLGEAEWEYACRAGTTGRFYFKDENNSSAYISGKANAPDEVGKKKPNAWGLYDMCGNVSEFCNGFYGKYTGAGQIDPSPMGTGKFRLHRGGGLRQIHRHLSFSRSICNRT